MRRCITGLPVALLTMFAPRERRMSLSSRTFNPGSTSMMISSEMKASPFVPWNTGRQERFGVETFLSDLSALLKSFAQKAWLFSRREFSGLWSEERAASGSCFPYR